MRNPAAVVLLLVLVLGLSGHGTHAQPVPTFDLPDVQVDKVPEKDEGIPLWKQVVGTIVAAIAGSYFASRKGASKGAEKVERELAPASPASSAKDDPSKTFREIVLEQTEAIRGDISTINKRVLLSDVRAEERHDEVKERFDHGETTIGRLELRVADLETKAKTAEEERRAETAARIGDVARLEEILKVRSGDRRTPRPDQVEATPPAGVPAAADVPRPPGGDGSAS